MGKKITRILRRVLAVVLAMVITIEILPMGAVNAYADTNDEPNLATSDAYGMEYSDWLSYMPGDIPISRINMPASHDSGCFAPMTGEIAVEVLCDVIVIALPLKWTLKKIVKKFAVEMSRTQDLNIAQQLAAGIRVFDIRGAYEKSDPEKLMVNHKVPMFKSKDSYDILRFKDVFNTINDFIKKHPDETVVLVLASEGIPYVPDWLGIGPKRAKELITEFCTSGIKNWPNFVYYDVKSEVPTLNEVRGKCVVLSSAYDDPLTGYENHYDVNTKEKENYLQLYFEEHNNKGENSLRSNKLAQYKKDIFVEENLKNHESGRPDGEPMVKMVNYSANVPSHPWPNEVASVINPEFGKNDLYKSEIRYGWIGRDFIGRYDPTDGIIESNIGCTNYYAQLNCIGNPSDYRLKLDDITLWADDGANQVEVDFKKYPAELKEEENKIVFKCVGLPLYTAYQKKYNYRISISKDICELKLSKHNTNNTYAVADGKWCGQIINDSFTALLSTAELPIEIQWIYDKQLAKEVGFKEPENRSDFFNMVSEFTVYQKNSSQDVKSICITQTGRPYMEELEYDSSKNVYKTTVKSLVKNNGKGESYKYDLGFARLKDIDKYDYYCEKVKGTDGCPRIVIHVELDKSKQRILGIIHWEDAYDHLGKRFVPLEDDKILDKIEIEKKYATSQYKYEKLFIEPSSVYTDKKETSFLAYSSKYDAEGNPCAFTQYFKIPKIAGQYVLADKKVDFDPQQPVYEAKYDFTSRSYVRVIWNREEGKIPDDLKSSGINIKLKSASNEVKIFTAKPSGDDSDWISKAEDLKLFAPDNAKDFGDYYYYIDESSLSELEAKLPDFKISSKTYMAIDNGRIERIYYVYCDYVDPEMISISGNVIWNDGLLNVDHKEDTTITLYKGFPGSEAGGTDISDQLKWDENNRHFYANLPAKDDSDNPIKYYIKSAPVTGYKMDESAEYVEITDDWSHDYKYTKLISVTVEGEPQNILEGSSYTLKRDGVEVERSEKYKFINLPIANDNNEPYEYSVEITPCGDYAVDYIDETTDVTTGNKTITVAFYKPVNSFDIPVKLHLEGIETDNDFEFEIVGISDKGIMDTDPLKLTKATDYKDEFTLDAADFSKAFSDYYLHVYQKAGNDAGIDYDEHESTVKVSVYYTNGQKVISLEWGEFVLENEEYVWKPQPDVNASEFTNKAKNTPAKLELNDIWHMSKVPDGSDYQTPSATFTYKLTTNTGTDYESTISQVEITDNGDGSRKPIDFCKEDALYFYTEGEYVLHVSTVESSETGWFLDQIPYDITFKVIKGASNQLEIADLTYDSLLTSKNNTITQLYTQTSYQIPVCKQIERTDSTSDTFRFIATDLFDDNVSVTATIQGAGDGKFDEIVYNEPGNYSYLVEEEIPDESDWECDDSAVVYTVSVTRNDNGSLTAAGDEKVPTFINKYMLFKDSIPVTVKWNDGKDIRESRPESVKFTLYDENGQVGASYREVSGSTEDTEWKYSTEKLPYYKRSQGEWSDKEYSVDVDMNGLEENYVVETYGGINGGLFIICTDKRLYKTEDFTIRAEWYDENDKLGTRPLEIPVSLVSTYCASPDSKWANYDNGWKVEFNEVPVFVLDSDGNIVEANYEPDTEILEWYNYNITFDEASGEYVIKFRLRDDVELWTEPVPDQFYTGKAIKPEVRVYSGTKLLTKGRDYTLKYSNNKRAGFATVTVVGKGNYKKNDSVIFNIRPKDISNEDVYVSIADKKLSSKNHISKPVIKYNGMTLKQGRDYTVEYSGDMTKEGTITATITGNGHNYINTRKVTYKIYSKNNSFSKMYVEKIPNQTFTGEKIYLTPDSLKVYTDSNKTKQLELNKDFTVSYVNNTNVGTAKAVIKGIGEYEIYGGTKEVSFKIVPQELTDANIMVVGDTTYSGSKLKPEIEVYLDGTRIAPKYYTISYKNNIASASENAVKAPTVQIKGKGNYSKVAAKKFDIEPLILMEDDVKVTIPLIKKSTEQVTVADVKPSIKRGKVTLKLGKDFTVDGITPIDDTYYKVKISFMGNYIGDIESVARVYSDNTQIILNSDDFTVNVTDMKHTGKAVKPGVEVIDNITGKKVNSKFYTVTYANNIDFSDTAPTVTVEGKGLYKGSITKHFRIYLNDIKKVYVAKIPNQTYTGNQVTISANDIKVYINKMSEEPLVKGTDYTVEFGENVRVGKGTVIIKGIGNYGGNKKVKFLILPKGVVWFNN